MLVKLNLLEVGAPSFIFFSKNASNINTSLLLLLSYNRNIFIFYGKLIIVDKLFWRLLEDFYQDLGQR